MEISLERRCYISVYDRELESFQHIVRLAHERLREAPRAQMKGVPLERRAGLVGPELFAVMQMLEKLGASLGVNVSFDEPPTTDSDTPPVVMTLAIISHRIDTPEVSPESA